MNLGETIALLGTLLPTPTVCGNHNRKGASANSGDGLATAVKNLLNTPIASDAKNLTLPPSQMGRDSVVGDLMRAGMKTGYRLRPAFAAWMMGYPPDWAEVEPEPKTRMPRNSKRTAMP